MSKIGKKIIIIPDGTTASSDGNSVEFSKGSEKVSLPILQYVKAEMGKEEIDGKERQVLKFSINSNIKQARANWGTMRALSQNIITGINEGFKKSLEIEGVGFRASMAGNDLVLNIGYSHPVKFAPMPGIKIAVEKNVITVSGTDAQTVGQTAAEIRKIKKPEPYKGKGIKYQGEYIKRKAGKKVGK